ncbi:hypothetical protein EJ05DRAFT_502879 [Pseudovirgaria hyperparasitica]|uniref:Uncharacterized protein n=1 Tax=Pseudovirgaria hyperparasitica TaxID=470096 RepID=A0A6A6W1G8_9PEZI|nr:uncharacterized protein EJ05DRAFT_502879 [Pseudovirgaria hyperparasitica]KAF2755417.1 hypothetical protein EJ05DRAFT_502879 [Pseudovirgaria hyperparasitica]
MVYIGPQWAEVKRLYAYVTIDLTPEQLNDIHIDFETGSNAKFDPLVELFIQDIQEYHGKSHSEIRRLENNAGRNNSFLLIDEHAVTDRALWYVEDHATADDVAYGCAQSTDVLWEILLKTIDIPNAFSGYECESSVLDDLQRITAFPLSAEFKQSEPFSSHGYDFGLPMVVVFLEPGDYEENTDMVLRIQHQVVWPTTDPATGNVNGCVEVPERVVRVTEQVASAWGLARTWHIPHRVEDGGRRACDDGTEFPKGTVRIRVQYTSDVSRPTYTRLEGSL